MKVRSSCEGHQPSISVCTAENLCTRLPGEAGHHGSRRSPDRGNLTWVGLPTPQLLTGQNVGRQLVTEATLETSSSLPAAAAAEWEVQADRMTQEAADGAAAQAEERPCCSPPPSTEGTRDLAWRTRFRAQGQVPGWALQPVSQRPAPHSGSNMTSEQAFRHVSSSTVVHLQDKGGEKVAQLPQERHVLDTSTSLTFAPTPLWAEPASDKTTEAVKRCARGLQRCTC